MTVTIQKLTSVQDQNELKIVIDKFFDAIREMQGEVADLETLVAAEPIGMTIKSIQRGTIALAGAATTGTATITAVDTTKTELRFLGQSAGGGGDQHTAWITLTNSTTITATRVTASGTTTVSWELTEYE